MSIFRFCLPALLGLAACSSPAASDPATATAAAPQPARTMQDTLVDVGGHRLHFRTWPGRQPAILFEAGGGDDLTVWQDLVAPVRRATGAAVVVYDRAGFGQSSLDSTRISLGEQVADLKTGLGRLGLDRRFLLVGHSFGGYFSTLFAARYPRQVTGAVLLDANHVSYYTDARTQGFQREYAADKARFRRQDPGKYWMLADALKHGSEMRASPFPATVPVVDILAEKPPVRTPAEGAEWVRAHESFVAAAPNRRLLRAAGSGHYVARDQPDLVVATIADFYRQTL